MLNDDIFDSPNSDIVWTLNSLLPHSEEHLLLGCNLLSDFPCNNLFHNNDNHHH